MNMNMEEWSAYRKSHSIWCSAPYCSNSKGKNPALSFFKYPKDPERCRIWMRNSKRDFLKVNKTVDNIAGKLSLCEEHFEASYFMNPADKAVSKPRKNLTKNAIPTLFQEPNPNKPTASKRKFAELSAPPQNRVIKVPLNQSCTPQEHFNVIIDPPNISGFAKKVSKPRGRSLKQAKKVSAIKIPTPSCPPQEQFKKLCKNSSNLAENNGQRPRGRPPKRPKEMSTIEAPTPSPVEEQVKKVCENSPNVSNLSDKVPKPRGRPPKRLMKVPVLKTTTEYLPQKPVRRSRINVLVQRQDNLESEATILRSLRRSPSDPVQQTNHPVPPNVCDSSNFNSSNVQNIEVQLEPVPLENEIVGVLSSDENDKCNFLDCGRVEENAEHPQSAKNFPTLLDAVGSCEESTDEDEATVPSNINLLGNKIINNDSRPSTSTIQKFPPVPPNVAVLYAASLEKKITPREISLKRQLTAMRSKVFRLRKTNDKLKEMLEVANNINSMDAFKEHARQCMSETAASLFLMQLRMGDKSKQSKWSKSDKNIALSLFSANKSVYRFLCSFFVLPSIGTLMRLKKSLKDRAELCEALKEVSMVSDEHVVYETLE